MKRITLPNFLSRLSRPRLPQLASTRQWRLPTMRMPALSMSVKSKKDGFIGVEIGARHVHLLEFKRSGHQIEVSGYGSMPLPDQSVTDDQVNESGAVGQAIRKAMHKSGIKTNHAAIAVSGSTVITKVIDMPANFGDEEIEEQIHFDAESYIPHPIDEVYLDFRILEPNPNDPEYNRVMLAACRRETVEAYIDAVKKGGLTVDIVDLSSFALQNACHLLIDDDMAHDEQASYAVFDIRTEQTRMTVQNQGQSIHSREIALATRSLIEPLIELHGLNSESELYEKLRYGTIDADMIHDDLEEFVATAAAQIEQSLQFFSSAAAFEQTINGVIITGDIGLFPGAESVFIENLDRPLRLGNSIKKLDVSKTARKNDVEWFGPVLAVASGLAIRSVR